MNFRQNTGKSIQQAFDEFHRNNPLVYHHFCKLIQKALNHGKKKVSSKMIINVIRWEIFIQTEEQTLFNDNGELKKFRINDCYTSRYARMYIDQHPDRKDIFELRELRS